MSEKEKMEYEASIGPFRGDPDELPANNIGKVTCLACRNCRFVAKKTKSGERLTQEERYDCGFCEKYTFLKPTSVYDENKDCEYFEER